VCFPFSFPPNFLGPFFSLTGNSTSVLFIDLLSIRCVAGLATSSNTEASKNLGCEASLLPDHELTASSRSFGIAAAPAATMSGNIRDLFDNQAELDDEEDDDSFDEETGETTRRKPRESRVDDSSEEEDDDDDEEEAQRVGD